MKTIAIFASLALAATAAPLDGTTDFKLCGTGTFTIKQLSYEPFPPKINNPVFSTSTGDLTAPIVDGAKMTLTAKIGSMVVATTVYDICKEAAKSGLNCPIAPGTDIPLKSELKFPEGVKPPPFVTINVHSEGVNADGSALFCLDTTAKFVP
jgi:hypothetical protein